MIKTKGHNIFIKGFKRIYKKYNIVIISFICLTLYFFIFGIMVFLFSIFTN